MERVVITGQGAISALGVGVKENWSNLKDGVCGIDNLDIPDIERLNIKIGAAVKNYTETDYFSPQQISLYDRFTQFAIISADEALSQAGLEINSCLAPKVGVVIGSAGGGLQTQDDNFKSVYAHKKKRLHPFIVPKLMNSAAASQLSIIHNIQGPSFTVSTACASSNHAMGQAFKMIQSGSILVALTGGTESMLCFGGLKAWEGLRVMTNDVCRPFSADRNGMVQGEGAAIFVFEQYEHARARGANILAEVIGFSMTSDASDVVKPNKLGAARAISEALNDSNLNPTEVDYINAHGTGTNLNDKTECEAIRQVFGKHAEKLMISSTKSMHGHLIGGAGAIELIASIMVLQDGVIPPTINYNKIDPNCKLDVVPNYAREAKVETLLSNAFAFGGMNAVLALKRI